MSELLIESVLSPVRYDMLIEVHGVKAITVDVDEMQQRKLCQRLQKNLQIYKHLDLQKN